MEYNGVLGEETGHKTPSSNTFAGREKKSREMKEIEEGRRRWGGARSNFKHDEAAVLNNNF